MTASNEQALSIVHFSTADNEGGSGRAAYRIHAGLRHLGHRSRMLVRYKGTSDADVDTVHGGGPVRLLDRATDRLTGRVGLQYVYFPSSARVARHPWVRGADVFQLYNTHGGYFSHQALPALSRRAPVVWRLSDMWPLTGHCAYAGECTRWQTGCGHCPDLRTYPSLPVDTTALLWRFKRHVYVRSDLTVVAPSSWIEALARQSPLLNRFPVYRIPTGIDLELFRPRDRRAARLLLDLDPSTKVVLFSAHVIDDNPRKGAPFLLEALRQLGPMDDTLLLLAGVGGESWQERLPLKVKALGYVRDDRLLAAAYAAADILAAPSVLENLPNSVLEAMACGVPVVAFDAGGVRDAVRHGETGFLATANDAADLANGLKLLLTDGNLRRRMGANARALMERQFDQADQARAFADLYRTLVDQRRARAAAAPAHAHA